ncbi:MAG: hypothetical protein H7A23_02805 [Leptospiraceae bacterium]|nr:hypothetical protein [Leptospiraceae bacterium]
MSEGKSINKEKSEGNLWLGIIISALLIVFVSGLKAFLPYKEPSPPPAIAKEETPPPPPPPDFSKLFEKFTMARNDFYKSELDSNLTEKTNKDISLLADEVNKATHEEIDMRQKIEKSYYLMNLYYYASVTSSDKSAKIKNADDSIKSAENVSILIKDVEERVKIASKEEKAKTKKDKEEKKPAEEKGQSMETENFSEIQKWIKKENIKEKVSFYQALDLSIKKLAGEDIKEKEILDILKAIPKEFMRKGKLYNHPTLKEVLERYEKEDEKNLGTFYPKGL